MQKPNKTFIKYQLFGLVLILASAGRADVPFKDHLSELQEPFLTSIKVEESECSSFGFSRGDRSLYDLHPLVYDSDNKDKSPDAKKRWKCAAIAISNKFDDDEGNEFEHYVGVNSDLARNYLDLYKGIEDKETKQAKVYLDMASYYANRMLYSLGEGHTEQYADYYWRNVALEISELDKRRPPVGLNEKIGLVQIANFDFIGDGRCPKRIEETLSLQRKILKACLEKTKNSNVEKLRDGYFATCIKSGNGEYQIAIQKGKKNPPTPGNIVRKLDLKEGKLSGDGNLKKCDQPTHKFMEKFLRNKAGGAVR